MSARSFCCTSRGSVSKKLQTLKSTKSRIELFPPVSSQRIDGALFVLMRRMLHQPDPQTFQIIGAAMEVHRQMNRGLFELFYCDALAVEFEIREIPFIPKKPIQLDYKGRTLGGIYQLDFICFNTIVVEVKATSSLTPADEAQLLNYLAMTKLQRGLLLNFGTKSLEYRRRVL